MLKEGFNIKEYYIYVHIDGNEEVIYVGKGSGKRAYNWIGRQYPKEEVKEIVILPMRYLDEKLAYEIERAITQYYKDLGQCRYNKDIGRTHSEETRKKLSEVRKGKYTGEKNHNYGKKLSGEHRKKISETKKGKHTGEKAYWYGKHHSEETKKKLSEVRKGKYKGENNPMYGKHHSEETKKKMSDNHADFKGENNPMYGKNPYEGKLEGEMEEIRRKISEGLKGNNNPRARKVKCHTGEIFDTLTEASEWCGLKNTTSITMCCQGKRKTTGKHPITGEKLRWEYIEEENENNL